MKINKSLHTRVRFFKILNHYFLKDKQMETFDLESYLQDAYLDFPSENISP